MSVWPTVVIRGDSNSIAIGANSNVQDGTVVHVSGPNETGGGSKTTIGQGVTIGHRAIIHGCRIDDYCLIGTTWVDVKLWSIRASESASSFFSLLGMGSIVLDNAHLEHHVFLAAGALVPPGKRLESGYLYVGQPAKQARKLTEAEIRSTWFWIPKLVVFLLMIRQMEESARHYVEIKSHYLEWVEETSLDYRTVALFNGRPEVIYLFTAPHRCILLTVEPLTILGIAC